MLCAGSNHLAGLDSPNPLSYQEQSSNTGSNAGKSSVHCRGGLSFDHFFFNWQLVKPMMGESMGSRDDWTYFSL